MTGELRPNRMVDKRRIAMMSKQPSLPPKARRDTVTSSDGVVFHTETTNSRFGGGSHIGKPYQDANEPDHNSVSPRLQLIEKNDCDTSNRYEESKMPMFPVDNSRTVSLPP